MVMASKVNKPLVDLQDINTDQPIDLITPVINLGGQKKIFISMLKQLEEMSLNSCMDQIANSLNNHDWKEMKTVANQLKGAASYVGSGRVYYICYHIDTAFHANDFMRMIEYYPLLVESCIEFKRCSRQYLAERRG